MAGFSGKIKGGSDNLRKIKPLEELSRILRRLRSAGKKVVQCHGVFDLLHPGHIRHLQAAKRRGGVLVVTVTKDEFVNKGPGRPVFNQDLRCESLAALGCVDYVALNDSPTAVPAIRKLRPFLYVKGADYRDAKRDLTRAIGVEEKAARSVGAGVLFTDEPAMSSTRLLNTHYGVYPPEARAFLREFASRYSCDEVIEKLRGLKSLKVLAVGEAIVDEYHYCQAMGKSPKETIVSTRYIDEEAFAGGVLAAANHAAGFVSKVRLVTALGTRDSRESFIRSKLKTNIKADLIPAQGMNTIIKRRFVDPAFLTKMFEVSYLPDRELTPRCEKRLLKILEREVPRYDVVLVTDYGHGLISRRVVGLLCRKARFLAVNTQTNSSNIGYNVITKYPRADYVCIDEPELRLAERDRFGDIESLVKNVARKLKVKAMVATRGHKGSLAYSKAEGFTHVPVLSQRVVDRTGAGDAYLSLSALCAAKGFPMDLVGFIGNAAGALQVGTVCNRTPVEPVALYKFITAMLSS